MEAKIETERGCVGEKAILKFLSKQIFREGNYGSNTLTPVVLSPFLDSSNLYMSSAFVYPPPNSLGEKCALRVGLPLKLLLLVLWAATAKCCASH